MIVLLLGSLGGYLYGANKKLGVQWNFIPLFVIAGITLFVYFGGLLGMLKASACIALAGGLVCLACFLRELRQGKIRLPRLRLFDISFLVGSVCFLWLLLRTRFQHYDNFSHWAVAVKYLLRVDSFPGAGDKIIEFSNYPLGTTSWIYYFCRWAGHGQGTMLFAQGLIIFAGFYALFGIIRERKRFLLYSVLGMGFSVLSIFNITIRINNLLVDFILPLLTMAAWAIIYRYEDDLKKAAMLLIPVLGLLYLVKTTGIVYVAFALVFLAYRIISNPGRRSWKNAGWFLLTAVLSAVPQICWKIHMKIDFAGVENKFDVSASNLSGLLGTKTPEEIGQITRLYLRAVFDLTTRPAIGFVLFEAAAIVACLFAAVVLKKKWKLLWALLALDGMVVLYYAGILALYLFSMPLDEALVLAGFERYASSIIILFGGGLVLCAAIDMENSFEIKIGDVADYKAFHSYRTKKMYQNGVVATVGISLLLLGSEYNGLVYTNGLYETSLPEKLEAVVGDRWNQTPDGREDPHTYLFYGSDHDGQMTSYYFQYVARYFMFAPQVDAICSFYEDNLLNLLSHYEYLVVAEPDGPERRLLKKYFDVDGEAGFYRIEKKEDHGQTDGVLFRTDGGDYRISLQKCAS